MKTRLILLLPFLFLFATSCEDSDSATLEVSKSTFEDISASGETLTIDITCSSSWTVVSNKQWCIPDKNKGENDEKLTLSININPESSSRTATVTIISNKVSKTINITQKGADETTEEYHYELPVIFHVLYQDKNNPLQYVSQKRLADILQIVNGMYKNRTNSVDMNLTFTLTTTGPNGETLTTPGVEYIEQSQNYPIDCETFMNDNSGYYVKYLWDPNKYINIMIYNFTSDPNSGSVTLGISHLPYSTTGANFLEGLTETKYSSIKLENLQFPYSVSINSLFINRESISPKYDPADVTVTLAHELGHYLGLHHTFSSDKNGNIINTCKDTDYCDDTPSYNKIQYDADYAYVEQNEPENYNFNYLVRRTNCSNNTFISYNIMDYSISYSNQFTPDQRARIRHVLSYSPLIPGPKNGQVQTRSTTDGPIDLPIKVIK